jgi:hypothetical protein
MRLVFYAACGASFSLRPADLHISQMVGMNVLAQKRRLAHAVQSQKTRCEELGCRIHAYSMSRGLGNKQESAAAELCRCLATTS